MRQARSGFGTWNTGLQKLHKCSRGLFIFMVDMIKYKQEGGWQHV